jgi:toxin YoeB
MKVTFAKDAYDHYCYWKANDIKVFQKINQLVKAIKNDPFKGIGKPEPLNGNLAGYWSRRITQEHRLV